jgi:hypothetical protein
MVHFWTMEVASLVRCLPGRVLAIRASAEDNRHWMGNRLLTAAFLLSLLVTCGRPDPVHRGDGGQAHPDDPDAGDPGGMGGAPDPTGGNGGSATGGSGDTGGKAGGAGTGGTMGTGGAGTGGAGTGGRGTGGTMGTGGAGTGGAMGTGGSTGGAGGGSTGGTGGGVGCSGAAEWRAGTYKGGDEVKHGNPAHRFRCKEYPFEGWCGISAYEPGVGNYWMMAWDDLGACP